MDPLAYISPPCSFPLRAAVGSRFTAADYASTVVVVVVVVVVYLIAVVVVVVVVYLFHRPQSLKSVKKWKIMNAKC